MQVKGLSALESDGKTPAARDDVVGYSQTVSFSAVSVTISGWCCRGKGHQQKQPAQPAQPPLLPQLHVQPSRLVAAVPTHVGQGAKQQFAM